VISFVILLLPITLPLYTLALIVSLFSYSAAFVLSATGELVLVLVLIILL
jgi:hypothetical protein